MVSYIHGLPRLSLMITITILSALIAPSILVSVHATAAALYIDPSNQPTKPPGSMVTYQVRASGIESLAGWGIMVKSTRSVLSPVNVSLSGNIFGSTYQEFVNCVNGGLDATNNPIALGVPGNNNCGIDDAPGIVHSSVVTQTPRSSGTAGLLFTMSFQTGPEVFDQLIFLTAEVTAVSGGTVRDVELTTTSGSYGTLPGGIPVAEFSWKPLHPVARDKVSFNASLSRDDPSNSPSGIQTYKWDLGDPTSPPITTTSPYLDHTYLGLGASPLIGNFSVRLTVTDKFGLVALINHVVEVQPPPVPCRQGLVFIQVPKDCPTIQSAINSVVPGGAIQVSSGTYSESLQVLHPLRLRGAGQDSTILVGSVFSEGSNVSISGFTINGALDVTSGRDNRVTNNTLEGRVLLNNAPHTVLSNNIVSSFDGLAISSSPQSIIHGNSLSNLVVVGASVRDYILAIDGSNTVKGKPVYYVTNANNPRIPADVGYLGLVNSSNVNIGPHSFPEVKQALLLVSTSGVTMRGINVAAGSFDILGSTNVLIENGRFEHSYFLIENSTLTTIRNNRIASLELRYSDNNRIIGNKFSPAGTSLSFFTLEGILINSSNRNEVSKNTISGSYYSGIILSGSTSNRLDGNIVQFGDATNLNHFGSGVDLSNSPRNVLRNNHLSGSAQDLSVSSKYAQCFVTGGPCALVGDYVQDIDTSNTVEGSPVYYLVNARGIEVPSNAGYLAIVKSTDIRVHDINLSFSGLLVVASSNVRMDKANITRLDSRVLVWLSHDITVKNSILGSNTDAIGSNADALDVIDSSNILVTGNRFGRSPSYPYPSSFYTGIVLSNSTNSRIEGNFIADYFVSGITLSGSSSNIINRNTIIGSTLCVGPCANNAGIRIGHTSSSNKPDNNLIIENTIANNRDGLDAGFSFGSTIYRNNFVNNSNQANGERNTWNNGAGQGNYWSDYKGQDLDNDGVGDTLVPHIGLDMYPLMKPWTPAGLSASFVGRGAWFGEINPDNSDGEHSGQALLSRVRNNGRAFEWVEAIFNITSSNGSAMIVDTGPVWLAKGQTVTLPLSFQGPPGTYMVKVQLRFSSDAFLSWTNTGTRNFTFRIDNEQNESSTGNNDL